MVSVAIGASGTASFGEKKKTSNLGVKWERLVPEPPEAKSLSVSPLVPAGC